MSLRLEIAGISKGYPGGRVLEDCSFSFSKGGVYLLSGPNGSGKSTLLRICALLEPPESGSVRYFEDEKPLAADIMLKRRITLLLPSVGVFNDTVMNNALYGLAVRGIKGAAAEKKALEVLEFAGLASRRLHNARTLSSGQKQRLGLARALAIEPEMLFLDEPTASVDPENVALIEEMIRRLREEKGRIIVMTTHDSAQAGRIADYRLELSGGRLS